MYLFPFVSHGGTLIGKCPKFRLCIIMRSLKSNVLNGRSTVVGHFKTKVRDHNLN